MIHIIDLRRAKREGKSGQAIAALSDGMTVMELNAKLDVIGLKG